MTCDEVKCDFVKIHLKSECTEGECEEVTRNVGVCNCTLASQISARAHVRMCVRAIAVHDLGRHLQT